MTRDVEAPQRSHADLLTASAGAVEIGATNLYL